MRGVSYGKVTSENADVIGDYPVDWRARLSKIAEGRVAISIDETALLLGVGRVQLYAAAKSGTLPTIRIGRRILVGLATLERILGDAP